MPANACSLLSLRLRYALWPACWCQFDVHYYYLERNNSVLRVRDRRRRDESLSQSSRCVASNFYFQFVAGSTYPCYGFFDFKESIKYVAMIYSIIPFRIFSGWSDPTSTCIWTWPGICLWIRFAGWIMLLVRGIWAVGRQCHPLAKLMCQYKCFLHLVFWTW